MKQNFEIKKNGEWWKNLMLQMSSLSVMITLVLRVHLEKIKRKRKVTNSLNTLKVKTRKLKQASWENFWNHGTHKCMESWTRGQLGCCWFPRQHGNISNKMEANCEVVMVNGQWSFLSITTIVETNGGPYMENTRISMTT